MVQGIDIKFDNLNLRFERHIIDEEIALGVIGKELTGITAAFPEGDFIGHKAYHASVIERNTWIASVCKDVSKEIAKYGLLGFLAWLGYHAWISFLAGPGVPK